ncbi:MAG: type I restriction endonuclease subunit R [Limnothrix sp. BL-A-16]|jgi:hypothetical protein
MTPNPTLAEKLTLRSLREQFGLTYTEEATFFPEWRGAIDTLQPADRDLCQRLRQRYRYYLENDLLIEEGIKVMLVAPLLEAAGLFDAPFQSRFEEPVALELANADEGAIVYRGRMDTLVVQDRLWILVIESKRMSFSLENGLAQILGYMLANPMPDRPVFGLLTNGGHHRFLKLQCCQDQWIYAESDEFWVTRSGDLDRVLAILKTLTTNVESVRQP